MILPYSQVLNGKETFFVEKITQGLYSSNYVNEEVRKQMLEYKWPKNDYFKYIWSCKDDFNDKIHTIRKDEKNRWQPGKLIHFVINNRSKRMWRFAPIIPVVSTQEIIIISTVIRFYVLIDGVAYAEIFKLKTYDDNSPMGKKMNILARNDGFDDYADFMRYFDSGFKGKIIHWTNFKY